MKSSIRAKRFFPSFILSACSFSISSCSDEPTPVKLPSVALVCEPQHVEVPTAKPLPLKITRAGALPASVLVDASGGAAVRMTLDAVPSRVFDPDVSVSYSSHGGSGVLGVGFNISGASSITRCPKSMALDGVLQSVQYDASDWDSLCLDGKRLIVVGQTGKTFEYRLIPPPDPDADSKPAFVKQGKPLNIA